MPRFASPRFAFPAVALVALSAMTAMGFAWAGPADAGCVYLAIDCGPPPPTAVAPIVRPDAPPVPHHEGRKHHRR